MRRRRRLNGVFDDMYASAAGAASTIANDVESAGRWVGQEFNDFSAQPGSMQAAANANAAAGDYPPGIVAAQGSFSQIQNSLDNMVSGVSEDLGLPPGGIIPSLGGQFSNTLFILAGAGLILFAIMEEA